MGQRLAEKAQWLNVEFSLAKGGLFCYYCFLYGAIAQLGERLHGMQEVASSNLVGSIEKFDSS